ncbi:hypothetical protein [Streptomyces sp. H27-S2]|uniref:hypothetical protein n=1 Tax=Streptomyces antarcticus TaxID=2996458 RepID=UPI00227060BA|nr:hypothetical protein [Streptomyces sp. H27-S2]MCY0954405.1 hypothetical protein [Streptomyces sp. H27-S2]
MTLNFPCSHGLHATRGRSEVPSTGGLDNLGHGTDDAAARGGNADDATSNGTHNGEEQLTTERREELQDEHVRLANEDLAWFQRHYRDDGHRWSKSAKLDGVELPILTKDADGKWISSYDMPHGPSEFRYNPKPMGTNSVPPAHETALNSAAANRRVSVDLTNAAEAFKKDPSTANQDALTTAQKAYDRQLPGVPNNSKISDALGEKAAELHVIPREFKNAVPITLPKTPNGANMFDAAYRLEEGEVLIVEAKAPKGELDWRHGRADPEHPTNPTIGDNGWAQGLRVQQGTRPHIRTILAEMTRRGGDEATLATELRTALKEGKLKYVLVKANAPSGSTCAGAKLEYFKV